MLVVERLGQLQYKEVIPYYRCYLILPRTFHTPIEIAWGQVDSAISAKAKPKLASVSETVFDGHLCEWRHSSLWTNIPLQYVQCPCILVSTEIFDGPCLLFTLSVPP